HLLLDRLPDALRLNQRARALAAELGDPTVIDEADEQRDALRGAVEAQVNAVLAQQTELVENPAMFYQRLQALDPLVAIVEEARLQRTLDEARLAAGWRLGMQLLTSGPDAGARLASLFTELAGLMERQQDKTGAALATAVAQRYTTLPHATSFTPDQLATLFRYIDEYLHALAPLGLQSDAYAFVAAWLEESFVQLAEHTLLYYEWAVRAERYNTLVGYPELDDRLWDLENRVELAQGPSWTTDSNDKVLLRFGAFIAAYNGKPHDASIAWEKLGEIDLAIHQAREAGELERAYNLMRQAGRPIPDALSTAVKLLRQTAQLIHKQHSLSDGERRALATQLTELLTALDPAPEDLDHGQEHLLID
ncbi:MAG: hypothetical protein R6W76_07890, partial [Caldilinea sp.]